MESEIIICECVSAEHQIVFNYFPETGMETHYQEVYMRIHLNRRKFWERLKIGVKYIFGHRSRYGDFDEIIIGKENKEVFLKLYNFLNK